MTLGCCCQSYLYAFALCQKSFLFHSRVLCCDHHRHISCRLLYILTFRFTNFVLHLLSKFLLSLVFFFCLCIFTRNISVPQQGSYAITATDSSLGRCFTAVPLVLPILVAPSTIRISSLLNLVYPVIQVFVLVNRKFLLILLQPFVLSLLQYSL